MAITHIDEIMENDSYRNPDLTIESIARILKAIDGKRIYWEKLSKDCADANEDRMRHLHNELNLIASGVKDDSHSNTGWKNGLIFLSPLGRLFLLLFQEVEKLRQEVHERL
jgi:hypothetical protein